MSSVTTRWAMPVDSSVCSVIVRFSIRSWYFTVPAFSVITGLNDGSHSAMRSPRLTIWPFSHSRCAPYGTRCVDSSRPSMSRMAISPERDSDRCRPRGSVIVGMSRNSIVPSTGASRFDCSLSCAAPPMWKVRIVSWVPGSPIDWAAMTPTASPMLTGVPRARSRP